MAEDKRNAEDKGYAQLTKDNIFTYGECIGLSDNCLSDDCASLLAEDVSYRIRETIRHSKQFMKHSKRKNLTVKDFNDALINSDVNKIYGHDSNEASRFINIKDADVFIASDCDVELGDCIPNDFPQELFNPPQIKAEWIFISGSATVEQINPEKECQLSSAASLYYEQITKAVLSSNEVLQKCALNDLKTNDRIMEVFPYLTNFISVGVKKLSHDLNQLIKILYTVEALCGNKSLFIGMKPCLDVLISSLLHCILEPLTPSINSNIDHWFLREYAAKLLTQIVNEWSTPVNCLSIIIENLLQEWINDISIPYCSYYGAICVFINFGPASIEYAIYPYLKAIWNRITNVDENSGISRQQLLSDAMRVQGILLHAAEMLLLNKSIDEVYSDDTSGKKLFPNHPSLSTLVIKTDRDPEFSFPLPSKGTPNSKISSSNHKTKMRKLLVCKQRSTVHIKSIYMDFYECFGDRISTRLPYIASYKYEPQTDKLISLFPDIIQSGEDMLNSFNEKEEENRSNASLDEEHSYDNNSVISDDQDQELCIKNTVSDPNLGIKLIITKLPRSKNSNSPDSPKNSKRKKLSLKIPKDTPENSDDDICFIRPTVRATVRPLNILFEGSIPVPVSELKHRKIGAEFKYQDDFKNKLLRKAVGKCRVSSKRKYSYKVLYNSCSLLAII